MNRCCDCKHVIWDEPGSGKFWNPANPYLGVHPETLARALRCKKCYAKPMVTNAGVRVYPEWIEKQWGPPGDNNEVTYKYCHFQNPDGKCDKFEASE